MPGIIAICEPFTCVGQRMQHLRQHALGVGAADEQRRRSDRLGIGLGEGRAVVPDLADQRHRVVAQQLLWRRRQPFPGAGAFERVHEKLPGRRRYRRPRSSRPRPRTAPRAARGRACTAGSSVASSSPPGSARISLRNRSGRRCATRKRDVSAAGMAHQVDRSGIELLDEVDHVVDVLRDRIGVADAVPMFGKESAASDRRDHAMLARQRPEHRRPDPEIAQRAVHADQRRAAWPTSR